MIPFFEKLLSEAKEFRHNDTFADLFDIAEDSTLFDSPFKQISSRWKQDVSDFIDILTNLIEINNSNLNVINKTFKWSKIAAQILYEVFTYARDQNLPSLLTVIDVISSNIKIENVIDLGIVKELFKETIVNPEEWQAANIELLKLSHDEKSKHFSLQLILLFWGFKFWKLFNKNSNDPDIVHNKDIRRFFAEINKFIPKSQNISIDEVKLNKMLPELFWTDFFRDVSKVLLYNVIPQTKVISNPESIIGLIVGLSLGDKKMIRVNLSKLIDKTGNNLLNGIFGIIVNDSSLETDIKAVWKKVKIRSDLTLNLLDLISSDKSKDIYNTCIELWEKYCSSANLVSAIVSLLNGDLSNVRVFADHFKIDNKLVSMLLAWASKNINLLTDSLADLSKIIGINSEKAANLMINLYCGKLHSVFELSDKDDNFGIANKQMMFELLSLIKISIQISDNEYQNQLDIPESRVNLKYLLTKLFEVIGYEMNDEDIEITKDKLSKHICNIIDAVWGIGKANDYLKVAFRKYMKNADRKLNKIWYDFPNKTHKIIQSSLKNVYKSAQTSIRNTNIKANKAISDHKKLLAAINSKTPIKFRAGTDKNIISYLDPFQGMWFRVGCLVNIYGSKLADHKFMICRTWSKRTKVDVMVCIPCSEFCHAGHTLVYKVKEYTKGVCFWGAYNIPNIRLNSESNPLYDIDDDRFQLNQSEWSLLKDNSSYSKCKKLMYKNKIEKEEFKENENDE